MASNALLGLLAGIGGFGRAVGADVDEARKEQDRRDALKIAQQKADDERTYRAADITLRRDALNQGKGTPLGDLSEYLGIPLKPGMDPNKLVDDKTAALMAAQKTREDERAGRMAQAEVLRRSAQPVPAQLTAPLGEGEDPEAAALIPRTAGRPAPANAQERMQAAELHEQAPLGSELLAKILGLGRPQIGGSAITPPPFSRPAYSINEKGEVDTKIENEPWNYPVVRGALADAGWQPGMKGYQTEFKALLDQPVATPPGGRATARTEGIRPPSFYGNGAPGSDAGPSAGPTGVGPTDPSPSRFKGEPAPVANVTAEGVAQAVSVRHSTNEMYEAIKNPEITKNYIGPYAQYWGKIQGGAPNEMLGKKPEDLVSLEQNMSNLRNYTIRLITGAAVRPSEEPRIFSQLPDLGNQPDEFKQKLTWTINNNERMERVIRSLALQNDANAKSIMAELGLDRINVIDVPKPFSVNRNAKVPPKVPEGGTRVRDPRTGRTGTVDPGEPIPDGLEVLR